MSKYYTCLIIITEKAPAGNELVWAWPDHGSVCVPPSPVSAPGVGHILIRVPQFLHQSSIHHIPNEALLSELGWLSGNPSSIVICRLCTCRSFPIEGGVESGDNLLKQQEAKIQSSSFPKVLISKFRNSSHLVIVCMDANHLYHCIISTSLIFILTPAPGWRHLL